MKKTLIALIIALFAITAQAQRITTNGSIILETGSISKHDTPDIYVGFTYSAFQTSYIANLTLTKPGPGPGQFTRSFRYGTQRRKLMPIQAQVRVIPQRSKMLCCKR